MPDLVQSAGDDDKSQQDSRSTNAGSDAADNSEGRLLDFLDTWCGMDADAEDTAKMLHGEGGAYYRDWLPKELGDALLSGRINPQFMSEREGMHFADQSQLNEFFRRRWLLWFPELPYPLDEQE